MTRGPGVMSPPATMQAVRGGFDCDSRVVIGRTMVLSFDYASGGTICPSTYTSTRLRVGMWPGVNIGSDR